MEIEMKIMEKGHWNSRYGKHNTWIIISLDEINRLDTTKEKTTELEDIATDTTKIKAQREK